MENEYTATTEPFAEFNRRTFFGILLIAGISALITVLVANLLNHFIVAPALCGNTGTTCQSSTSVSFHIASLIASIAAVAMMVNLSVYRPLLVVMAALIGSWGMYNTPFPLINSPWFWQLGSIFFVSAVAYLAFAWILRAYNLVAGLALTLIVTVLMALAVNL